jgi:hypothetical protein
MTTYKLSAPTEEQIKSYLAEMTEHDEWEQYASNLGKGIHNTVWLGILPDRNSDPENPTYREGFNADIHATDEAELTLPDYITLHNPTNPVHGFGQ